MNGASKIIAAIVAANPSALAGDRVETDAYLADWFRERFKLGDWHVAVEGCEVQILREMEDCLAKMLASERDDVEFHANAMRLGVLLMTEVQFRVQIDLDHWLDAEAASFRRNGGVR